MKDMIAVFKESKLADVVNYLSSKSVRPVLTKVQINGASLYILERAPIKILIEVQNRFTDEEDLQLLKLL